jgi:hypothetical protein
VSYYWRRQFYRVVFFPSLLHATFSDQASYGHYASVLCSSGSAPYIFIASVVVSLISRHMLLDKQPALKYLLCQLFSG